MDTTSTPAVTVEQIRESAAIAQTSDRVFSVTTTTVTYEVQEYLPHRDAWIPAYTGFEVAQDAQNMRKRFADVMETPEHFRAVEVVVATTTKVID